MNRSHAIERRRDLLEANRVANRRRTDAHVMFADGYGDGIDSIDNPYDDSDCGAGIIPDEGCAPLVQIDLLFLIALAEVEDE